MMTVTMEFWLDMINMTFEAFRMKGTTESTETRPLLTQETDTYLYAGLSTSICQERRTNTTKQVLRTFSGILSVEEACLR